MFNFFKFSLFIVFIISGCDRFKDSRIQGHWKLISGTNVNTRNQNIFFRFEKGRVAVSKGLNTGVIDTCSYGRYYIKNGICQ